MDEILRKVDLMIDESNNIPQNLKLIFKAICKGYIRESGGLISLKSIKNVCDTVYIKHSENDTEFSGENNILGATDTSYDVDGRVIHKMDYVLFDSIIKLIATLTHELGHVMTEYDIHNIIIKENGDVVYPIIKRTATYYTNCSIENDELVADGFFGIKISDGFLEHICSRIWANPEFRLELKNAGYDLKDYVYKDERLFPSRVYDDYRACFELFDYIMDGRLFEFSCIDFDDIQSLIDYINRYRINFIFGIIDKSNDLLWKLKKYEGKASDSDFLSILENYQKQKNTVLNLSIVLMEACGKDPEDPTFKRLYDEYSNTLSKQKTMPLPSGSSVKPI